MSILGYEHGFVRLRASGRDRAKFLHNFCTNNVKALIPGDVCEAFFADVKAKTLAHGFVLALEDFHEIWMLPGDSVALEKHLNRYVIAEDVRIAITSGGTRIFLQTPELLAELEIEPLLTDSAPPKCFAVNGRLLGDGLETESVTGFVFSWDRTKLVALGGSSAGIDAVVKKLAGKQLMPVASDVFELLRISERFPVIGRDMTGDNLAPEAERNRSAISYTKGCYLGQEPIARLDAMGHVNRALRVVEISGAIDTAMLIGSSLVTADGATAGTLTSAVLSSAGSVKGLAMVRVNLASQALSCVAVNGEKFEAALLPVEG